MNRDSRASLAQETLRILQQGTYLAPSGRLIDISQDLAAATQGSRLYRPSDFPEELPLALPAAAGEMQIAVTPETTLEAAQRLAHASQTKDILCLNFASAKNPGGGFLSAVRHRRNRLRVRAGSIAASCR